MVNFSHKRMSEDKKNTHDTETPNVSTNEGTAEGKTFTQTDVDKILTERLTRAENKWQKETEKRIAEMQEEVLKTAQMSAEEREKELAEKYNRELEAKAQDVAKRENRLDAIEMFAKSQVPVDLVDYVISPEKEKTLENAEAFVKRYNDSVASSVAEQLKGKAPKDISVNSEKQQPKKVVTAF